MVDFEKYSEQRMNWLDITGGTAITVLDYFAGKALMGLMSQDVDDIERLVDDPNQSVAEFISSASYTLAEAMLAERNKRFTPQGEVKGVTGKTYG